MRQQLVRLTLTMRCAKSNFEGVSVSPQYVLPGGSCW